MKLLNMVQTAISLLPDDINGDYFKTIEILMDIDSNFIEGNRKASDTAHFIWTRLDTPGFVTEGRQALIDWKYLLSRGTERR